MSLASLAGQVDTIHFYVYFSVRVSIMDINYHVDLPLGPSRIGPFTPNTSCLRLDFLEAELETDLGACE